MSFLARLMQSWATPQASPVPPVPAPKPEPPKPVLKTALGPEDFARAAAAIGAEVAAVKAVAEVESRGAGFLADGRPTILFEAHVFHRQTKGRFAGARDRRGVALSVPAWDRSLYGKTGAWQWDRLEDAMKLDREAALRSASWGIFQIMGFNHVAAGHPTVEGFAEAMRSGAGPQLDAFVSFLKSSGLSQHLAAKDWRRFARGFNGPGFEKNAYDTKIAAAYAKHAAKA
jgi:hypothetical protein